ncbi:ribonuclease H-like domain-containing protein, partial [Mycena epipterygia]
YIIATHNVSPEKKSVENLLEIVLEDMKNCEDELGIIMIGYCTDNGGGERGTQIRLRRRKPKLVVPPCWGHQMNLVVAKVLELGIPCMESINEGLDIVKWFTNHSRVLELLRDQQQNMEHYKETHRFLTLTFPMISRWIFHFLAVRRMLTLSPPMCTLYIQDYETLIQRAGDKVEAKAKAREVLALIDDPQFWKNLTEVKILLEPLAVTAKCMQAPDAGLDQVLLMLGNLYRIYGSSDINSRVRTCVRKTLYTENPAVKPISIYNFAKQLYTRFFDEEPDLDFHAVFFDYSKNAREFSSSYMHLAEMKQLYERQNQRVDVVKIWEQCDTGETNGRNGLAKLAMWVLSIVANSAGSERGCSKFGLFLTTFRSQLSIQKVRKMNTVDMDLKRKH